MRLIRKNGLLVVDIRYSVAGLRSDTQTEYPTMNNIPTLKAAYNLACIYKKANPNSFHAGVITRDVVLSLEDRMCYCYKTHTLFLKDDFRLYRDTTRKARIVNYEKEIEDAIWNMAEAAYKIEKFKKMPVSITNTDEYEDLIRSLIQWFVRYTRSSGFLLAYDFKESYLDKNIDFMFERLNDELMYRGLRTVDFEAIRNVLKETRRTSQLDEIHHVYDI